MPLSIGGLQNGLALFDGDLPAVDRQRDGFHKIDHDQVRDQRSDNRGFQSGPSERLGPDRRLRPFLTNLRQRAIVLADLDAAEQRRSSGTRRSTTRSVTGTHDVDRACRSAYCSVTRDRHVEDLADLLDVQHDVLPRAARRGSRP